jgi:hypothetical protein
MHCEYFQAVGTKLGTYAHLQCLALQATLFGNMAALWCFALQAALSGISGLWCLALRLASPAPPSLTQTLLYLVTPFFCLCSAHHPK